MDKITANTTPNDLISRFNEVIDFLNGGGGNLVGTVMMFSGNTIPDKCLLCDGSAVSRTVYAALFAVIGTTYGTGNGSTTFNLPNFTGRVAQGATTAGAYKEAGLPNITGGIATGAPLVEDVGALYIADDIMEDSRIDSSGTYPGNIGFDASRSNSIYGNSTTVQPPALTQKFCIKYA